MALSNIFREPRREITESLVGIIAFGGLIYGDYAFGAWMSAAVGNCIGGTGASYTCVPVLIGMMIGIVFFAIGIFALVLAHFLGDAICTLLDNAGIHLRPRNRR